MAQDKDAEVVIVSSGAVASGFRILEHSVPATRLKDRQAAAAVGQGRLMRMWSDVSGTRRLAASRSPTDSDRLVRLPAGHEQSQEAFL
ncbi:MAG: hypothetical protein HOE14_07510, partial [Gemmatimonadales bacterium]|nr:hypothetical protein [Gemmatimonadales bacterium]